MVIVTLLLTPWPQAAIAATAQAGAPCSTPLEIVNAAVAAKKKKPGKKQQPAATQSSTQLICWQDSTNFDNFRWVAYSQATHGPFTPPTTATWRRIPQPTLGGNPGFLPTANSGIGRLSAELDHYWIEVDADNGKKITAAVWAPKGASNLPVIIYNHGTAGFVYWENDFAASLAKAGYVVVAPLWFARTSFQDFFPAAQLPGLIENPNAPAFTGANMDLIRTLQPVVTAAAAQPGVNPSRIGIAGGSRGGTVALLMSAMTSNIKAVGAVVPPFLPTQLNSPMYRGQVWEITPKSVVSKMMKPAMIVSASNDETVPPSSTQDFLSAAAAAGRSNIQSTVVPGGHSIGFSFNAASSQQVRQALINFFAANL